MPEIKTHKTISFTSKEWHLLQDEVNGKLSSYLTNIVMEKVRELLEISDLKDLGDISIVPANLTPLINTLFQEVFRIYGHTLEVAPDKRHGFMADPQRKQPVRTHGEAELSDEAAALWSARINEEAFQSYLGRKRPENGMVSSGSPLWLTTASMWDRRQVEDGVDVDMAGPFSAKQPYHLQEFGLSQDEYDRLVIEQAAATPEERRAYAVEVSEHMSKMFQGHSMLTVMRATVTDFAQSEIYATGFYPLSVVYQRDTKRMMELEDQSDEKDDLMRRTYQMGLQLMRYFDNWYKAFCSKKPAD